MILLGTVKDEASARMLVDAMYLEGIAANAEPNKRSEWDLWIVDMDQEEVALRVLTEFQRNPQSARFGEASRRAEETKKTREAAERRNAVPVFTPENMPGWSGGFQILSLTGILIVISVVVTVATSFGPKEALIELISISNANFFDRPPLSMALKEVRNGEIWRLITPIFWHASIAGPGIFHILFNMLWLKDLGGAIERKRGSLFLAVMVLLIGVISNVGQYFWAGSMFGGMSGVLYGLLGYIWVQGRLRPFSGLFVPPQVMTWMMLWLVFGFLGFLGVANGCHTVGLVTGLLLGLLPYPPEK